MNDNNVPRTNILFLKLKLNKIVSAIEIIYPSAYITVLSSFMRSVVEKFTRNFAKERAFIH